MKHGFAKTKNVRAFLRGTTIVAERGAREASWMFLHGEAGTGKTSTLQWWAISTGAIYLRAKRKWRARWFLQELVEATGGTPAHYSRDLFQQALEGVTRAQDLAEGDSSRFPAIIIDEAENATHDSDILETARDISDLTEVPVVICGMGQIVRYLTKRPQIYSRFAEVVEFGGNDKADVRQLCDELAQVEVADDLVARVATEAKGRMRLALNAVGRIEAQALRNGLERVTAADVAGIELVRDIDALAARARRPVAA